MAQPRSALKKRFESKVDSSGEHHLWKGACDPLRGTGRATFQGKDITAHRLAWELYVEPVPPGAKVVTCPDEPACVRIEHLTLAGDSGRRRGVAKPPPPRMPKGAGSIVELRDGVYKLTVTAGAHPDGRQRRVVRTVHSTRPQAAKQLAGLVDQIGDGAAIPRPESKDVTVAELIGSYLSACTEASDDILTM